MFFFCTITHPRGQKGAMRKPRLTRRILLGLKDCTSLATATGPHELFGVHHPTAEHERDFTRAVAANAWVDAMLDWHEKKNRVI